MNMDPVELMPGRILVVDDEQHIHASIHLRLAAEYDLVFCHDAKEALKKVSAERFDLCFADIHMPQMDGFAFIDAARGVDPGLGYVVLSAFDNGDNLRRTIPLQVYDFISKPLPDHRLFECRIPDWINSTRKRRREHDLAQHANTLASERDSARMERDVELVASESARDGFLQIAGLLTTINAHSVNACSVLGGKVKGDPSLMPLLRGMEASRRATEAVVNVAERFFGSAYANRDTSPALVNEGIQDALGMAERANLTPGVNKSVHFMPIDAPLPLRGLSGIGYLLMIFPALAATLTLAPANSTVTIRGEYYTRLDAMFKDPKLRSHLWLNKRNALTSHPACLIVMSSSCPAMERRDAELWLNGEYEALQSITPRGIIQGIQKCQGLLGFSIAPAKQFHLCLAVPT
jgi:CheY-like chemotaxis protein